MNKYATVSNTGPADNGEKKKQATFFHWCCYNKTWETGLTNKHLRFDYYRSGGWEAHSNVKIFILSPHLWGQGQMCLHLVVGHKGEQLSHSGFPWALTQLLNTPRPSSIVHCLSTGFGDTLSPNTAQALYGSLAQGGWGTACCGRAGSELSLSKPGRNEGVS